MGDGIRSVLMCAISFFWSVFIHLFLALTKILKTECDFSDHLLLGACWALESSEFNMGTCWRIYKETLIRMLSLTTPKLHYAYGPKSEDVFFGLVRQSTTTWIHAHSRLPLSIGQDEGQDRDTFFMNSSLFALCSRHAFYMHYILPV
jgi:hypothetical protein